MSRGSDEKPSGWLSSIRGLFGGRDNSNSRKRTIDRSFEEDTHSNREGNYDRHDGPSEPVRMPVPKVAKRTFDDNVLFTSSPRRPLPEKTGNASFSFLSASTKHTADDGPSSTSFVELYPTKDANVIDLRSKILTPASKTRMLYNQLDRISSPARAAGSPKLPTLPSLDGWQTERWARTPTQTATSSHGSPRKAMFTPSRLHEISVHLAKSTNKPYWRPISLQPRTASTPLGREERAERRKDDLVLDDTPSTSKTTKFTEIVSSEATVELCNRTPVLKGITGRNVAPNARTNVFRLSDDDLLTTPVRQSEESALDKIKPLDFGKLPKVGFLAGSPEGAAFTFAAPVVREAKPPETVMSRSFEKESSPESVVTDHDDSESEAVAEENTKKTTPFEVGDACTPKEKVAPVKDPLSSGLFRTSSPEIRITPAEKETGKPEETGARSPKLLQPPPPFIASVPKPAEAKDKAEVPTMAPPAAKKWSCPTCWVQNDDSLDACPCCQTAKPGPKEAPKKDAANWNCSECWVPNKATDEQCVCCQTAKPGAKPAENGTQQKTTGVPFKPTVFAPAPSGGVMFGISNAASGASTTTAAPTIAFGTAKPAESGAALSFGFSAAPPSATTTTAAAASKPSETATIPSFGFQAAATSATSLAPGSTSLTTATTTTSSLPAFPMPKTTTTPAAPGSLFAAPAAGPIFGFGSQKPEERKAAAPFTSGPPAVSAAASAAPAASSASSQSLFTLPTTTASAAPIFGAGSAGSLFPFAAAASTSTSTVTSSAAPTFSSPFGSLTTGTASPFAFGSKPAEPAASSAAPAAPISFGAPAVAGTLGGAMNGTAATDAPSAKRAHMFAFGGQPQTNGLPGSNSAPNLSAFGAPGSQAPGFGAQAGTTQQGFNFGTPSAPTATGGFNFGAAAGSTGSSFNFGAPAANGGSTFQFGATGAPTQNGTAPASSTFQFGAAAAPAFGGASVGANPLVAPAMNPFSAGGASSTVSGRKILRAKARGRK
ncbi:Zn-finger in Ran binding protein and others containing protein [Aphelenchoides avenae]|nr:Zn-finger in Ran binding protein and others containing protein [Aphelenchus avenae]